MKYVGLLLVLLMTTGFVVQGQNLVIHKISDLDPAMEETSGLLMNAEGLWTHNDSGNEPLLYLLDTTDGSVRHSLRLTKVSNTDWEAICSDGQYVYIGDFGNNMGNRTDLRIYRINADSVNTATDSILADTIGFHYPNQTQFEWDAYSTNFDCEAMLAQGDSLYLFSKNWGNEKTYLYALPKTPGYYAANLLDSMDVGGLVTDVAADTLTNNLLILGYSRYMTSAFVYHLYHYFDADFFDGERQKYNLSRSFRQLEGITIEDSVVWMSSEAFQTNDAALFLADFDVSAGIDGNIPGTSCFYPNPAKNELKLLNCDAFSHFRISSIQGKKLLSGQIHRGQNSINISCLETGTYILEFFMKNQSESYTDVLIVK
jgi:hypothetical protein